MAEDLFLGKSHLELWVVLAAFTLYKGWLNVISFSAIVTKLPYPSERAPPFRAGRSSRLDRVFSAFYNGLLYGNAVRIKDR